MEDYDMKIMGVEGEVAKGKSTDKLKEEWMKGRKRGSVYRGLWV